MTTLLDPLVLVQRDRIDPRSLARDVDRGLRIRVKRGAYYDAPEWQALTDRQRHRIRIEAFAASHPGLVFSHYSAAVLHGIPFIGGVPDVVHVVSDRANGGRSEPGLVRHGLGITPAELTELGVLRAETPVRAVVGLAVLQPFRLAVAPADHVLHTASIESLQAGLELANLGHGFAKARRVIEFADALAANPGESLSRAVIHELGFPAPMLQVEHTTALGHRYFTDFEWPGWRLAGEFDGKRKYLKPEYLGRMTPGEAVVKEKRREDELRAGGLNFARWDWTDALSGHLLRDILLMAGLPRRS
ncbi:hypothetical protein ABIB15_001773 [Marisediminicola sp. UYEF4]|uniref:hypothetical protein n=1 Tax=Marisediminicola sp. UYEF4 TaxID=1756384 RepID=UPI0033979E13